MLDGRFDPALAALFAGEESDLADQPSLLTVAAVAVIAVAVAAILSWPIY